MATPEPEVPIPATQPFDEDDGAPADESMTDLDAAAPLAVAGDGDGAAGGDAGDIVLVSWTDREGSFTCLGVSWILTSNTPP